MEISMKLKEIDIKNCSCYYFYDVMRVVDMDFCKILSHEKSYENILIYDISYKTSMGAKPLRIWFKKIDLLKFFIGLDIKYCLVLKD